MYFIVGLLRTRIGLDSVFLVVDRFKKMIHFIQFKTKHDARNIANLFFKEVGRIHGLPRSIVAGRYIKFMGHFGRPYGKGWEKI